MPTFIYTAKSQGGEEKKGIIEAASERELAVMLRQEGFFLTSASLAGGDREKAPWWAFLLAFFKHVSLEEKMVFTRHLATMVKAGLSLNKAIGVLASQSKNYYFKEALYEITDSVTAGKSFSESLKNYPRIFSDLFISMVRVGETAGNLETILMNLAVQMEKDHELRARVRGAMIYPTVILSVMAVIGVLMMTMVLPKLTSAFKEMDIALPPTTILVMAVGDFFQKHTASGIIWLILIVVLIRFLLKTSGGKKTADFVILNSPILANFSRKVNVARFARNFGSLIDAGVPIFHALQIVASTMSNSFFRKSLEFAATRIQQGEALSKVLANYNRIYPVMVIQMVEVGETTGSLTDILKNLAEFYENEVDNETKNLSSVIEPVLMIIIGIAVGFFAVSMIQPMYSMIGQM